MEKKPTIRDIATMTGYSFKTVSRVINQEPNVKPATKAAIEKAIAETNYKPNMYARNLNGKKLFNILVSIRKARGQNTTQWFDMFMAQLIGSAQGRPYTIIQEVIYDDSELSQSMLEQSGGYIDVLVLFYVQDEDKRIEMARRSGIPFVSFEKHPTVPLSVSNNNRKGMLDAAAFLFGRGVTRICLLLGGQLAVNREREEALKAAYRLHGIPEEGLEIVYGMNNFERIKQYAEERIREDRLPEVFFVSGDEKALAIYHAVYSSGRSIPGDVGVIGFDNIPSSAYYYPPLTTMGQNFGQLAAEMLTVVDHLVAGTDEPILSIEVDPELIIRQSIQ
ncbi:LacI family DNA-binding transcriptional regulator [Paenibacillus sp. 1P07SE]|uniref:LacI family DNA-binding transcriptional regulator n=1 Tax=Paenibacillus sp. 1P07SE TaxID=3132209 RepID=UPI0039A5B68E